MRLVDQFAIPSAVLADCLDPHAVLTVQGLSCCFLPRLFSTWFCSATWLELDFRHQKSTVWTPQCYQALSSRAPVRGDEPGYEAKYLSFGSPHVKLWKCDCLGNLVQNYGCSDVLQGDIWVKVLQIAKLFSHEGLQFCQRWKLLSVWLKALLSGVLYSWCCDWGQENHPLPSGDV